MKFRKIFILITASLLAVSCRKEVADDANRAEKINISIVRCDRLLDEYVRYNSFTASQKLKTEHIQETKILIEDVLSIGNIDDEHIYEKLKTFYSDTTLLQLTADVETKFPNLTGLEADLTTAFKNLHREAPSIRIPKVYTQVSALNQSIVVGDSLLGISLDKYMGEDYPLYQRYYHHYQLKSMQPERIAPDCMTYYLLSEYPLPIANKTSLLNAMLHHGKINYAVQQLLEYPSIEDAMGYSNLEKKWCKENLKMMWAYTTDSARVHSSNPALIRKYIGLKPDPFFGKEAPVQPGLWLGSKIIASYMKHNKKTSLLTLLRMTDYERILAQSDFKP